MALFGSLAAQQPFLREKRDYVWMFGFDTTTQLNGKNIWLDFSDFPVSTHDRPGTMSIDIANTGICDTAGNLLFYTNGFVVMNGSHEIVENGEGLNPGVMTNDWLPYGQPLDQGAIALPLPGSDSIYYLIHARREYLLDGPDIYGHTSNVFPLYYSVVSISTANSNGALIEKNIVIEDNSISTGKLTAVRHANGRDWWIIVFNYFANTYHRLLLHPQGISELPVQSVGDSIPSGVGQAVFSPDGSKYAKLNLYQIGGDQYIDIYDFDRCAGLLYNPLHLIYNEISFHGGLAFSPNSRYLYLSSDRYVYQYDMQAQDIEASKIVIANVPPVAGETDFALAQLGPDQKVYISGHNIKALHIIHNPNAAGAACYFEKEALTFNHFLGRSIPNHPYYGLGPLDGSPCDTLGIDHYPQAAFRHQEQALEVSFWDYSLFAPTGWYWDFGDGSAGSTQQSPVHTYPAPGAYEVCLTVSNANSSDTYCEWIEVVATSLTAPASTPTDVRVYPNPATAEIFLVIGQRPAGPLVFSLYDALGREVLRRAAQDGNGEQRVDVSGLPAGVYFWRVSAGGSAIEEGKLILIKE